METPQNDFQIYRPINDTWQAVSSLGGDIGGRMSKNIWIFGYLAIWLCAKTITRNGSAWIVYGSLNLKIVFWALHTNLQEPPKDRSKIPTFFLAQASA